MVPFGGRYHQVWLLQGTGIELLQRLDLGQRNSSIHSCEGVMNSVSNTTGGGLRNTSVLTMSQQNRNTLEYNAARHLLRGSRTGYKIVSTGIKEFDYPEGNENVYASYQGKEYPSQQHLKRLLFAWTPKGHQYSADLLPDAQSEFRYGERSRARLPGLPFPASGP